MDRSHWLAGQNKFRQLMLKHFSPRDNVGNLPGSIASASYSFNSWDIYTSTVLKSAIQAIQNAGLALNTFWEDTGWYTLVTPLTDPPLYAYLTQNGADNLWLSGASNWIPDGQRFPADYAGVSDAAHAAGMKSLLWFEPERVSTTAENYGTFAREHRLLVSHLVSDPNPNLVKIYNTYNLSDYGNVNLMATLISPNSKNALRHFTPGHEWSRTSTGLAAKRSVSVRQYGWYRSNRHDRGRIYCGAI